MPASFGSPLAAGDASSTSAAAAAADDDDRVFLVLHRWWRGAQEGAGIEAPGVPYAAAPAGPTSYGMKVLSMFISDQVFTLRRADDLLLQAAAAARSYALVAADLFTRARAWYIDSGKSGGKDSLLTEEGSVNIYPIMLRVSVTRDSNALTVKISKKDNSAENFKRANKILTADSEPVHIWDFSGRTTFILMNEWNRMPQDPRSSDQEFKTPLTMDVTASPWRPGGAERMPRSLASPWPSPTASPRRPPPLRHEARARCRRA